VAIVPEANGFLVVNREYGGDTPIGMPFSTLAGQVGGGVQTPGFLGVGRRYLLSDKFISYEGGLRRIVWLPTDIKESLGEDLVKRCEEMGLPDLVDKIADETICEADSDKLLEFLAEKGHPALEMEPVM
jgi:acetyl-CoA synthase